MKEFVISEVQTETAVLVGLVTKTQDERRTNEYLDELAFLAETAGAQVVKRFTQKLDSPNSVTYVGKGKLEEIKQYVEEYNYTYSGIHKALIYHFEIKGGSVEKANGGIGIVPYVYQNAYRYYYALWEAQQKNKDKVVHEYVPVVKEIIIPVPQRQVKKRKLFTFLDEEVEHGQ